MAAKQGFLMYYSKGDAIGTKVSVRYRRSGRLSGVVVKRGSTVVPNFRGAQFRGLVFSKISQQFSQTMDPLASIWYSKISQSLIFKV